MADSDSAPGTSGNPRQNVTFASNGQQGHGYLAVPDSGQGPGVIVIQEWWGLVDQIVGVADRLAAEGFVALAPDLFGGRTTHDEKEAARLIQSLPVDQAARDLSGAVDFLLEHQAVTSAKLGLVGFCVGGGFVLTLAGQAGSKIGAAVPYYGLLRDEDADLSGIQAPVLGHFGNHDEMNPPEQAKALEERIRAEAGVDVTFHYYDAGHAFANEENLLGTYDAGAAEFAWQRTLQFLRAAS